jgi:hypothetical protein
MCYFCTTLSIKRSSRLIRKNQARIADECPCYRHTLALTPGEFPRSYGDVVCQADGLQARDCPSFALTLAPSRIDLEGHRHVLGRVQEIEQPVFLENKPDPPSDRHSLAVTGPAQLLAEHCTTTRLNGPQRADEGHQRSLAASRRAGEEDYFTRLYGQLQIGQDASPKRTRTECVREITNLNSSAHAIRKSQRDLLR